MNFSQSTSWTMIRGAAGGSRSDREIFVRRYGPAVEAYLAARWKRSPLGAAVHDAAQEVFLECFRQGGVLQRVERRRPGGFRAFLFGTVRNVARTTEGRFRKSHGQGADLDVEDVPGGEDSPSRAFDRAWALSVLREAAELHRQESQFVGGRAARRAELLRLRFHEDIPLREIARLWELEPAFVHHEYARARQEFKQAIERVLHSHHPGSPEDCRKAWDDLKELLGT